MITSIYCADLHLDGKPSNEYRWKFFDWLVPTIQQTGARYLFILGDITDRKDEHTGVLINKVLRNLRKIANALTENSQSYASIFILKGNHDL